MADGIRLMTLRRGVDPRRFALLSFGGAAGLHAVEVARELEIPRVIVPTVASVLSAWGMLSTDLRYETSRTHIGEHAVMDEARNIFAELEARATPGCAPGSTVRSASNARRRCATASRFSRSTCRSTRSTGMRHRCSRIHEEFHRRHEELYTYSSPDQEVVFVNARAAAVGEVSQRGRTWTGAIGRGQRAGGKRKAWFGGWRDTPIYDIASFRPALR